MFTMENTEGFTQAEVDELNRRLEIEKRRLGFYDTDDEDLRAQIEKSAADIVNNQV
jgi:hypothetical protein